MEILFMLIAFSVLIAVVFLVSFLWSVRSGQYDDNYTPAVRMLLDDDPHAVSAPVPPIIGVQQQQ